MKHLTIGSEWEVCFSSGVSRNELVNELQRRGAGSIKVTGDGSIVPNSSGTGWELVFPPMADCEQAWAIYTTAQEVCESFGAYINETCGHHVHISNSFLKDGVTPSMFTEASILQMENTRTQYLSGSDWFEDPMSCLSIADIIRRYHSNQATILKMLPPSRSNNRWAKDITDRTIARLDNIQGVPTILDIQASVGQGKYWAINSYAWSIGTIEFRQGAGTFNMIKTREWTRLLMNLVRHSRENRIQNELGSSSITTPQRGSEIFSAQGFRSRDQYDLMRSENGATVREIMEAMGGSEGNVRRRVTELRQRLGQGSVITHTLHSQGGCNGDGIDHTRYQVPATFSNGQTPSLMPENRIGVETIYALSTDAEYDYWQARIAHIETLSRS